MGNSGPTTVQQIQSSMAKQSRALAANSNKVKDAIAQVTQQLIEQMTRTVLDSHEQTQARMKRVVFFGVFVHLSYVWYKHYNKNVQEINRRQTRNLVIYTALILCSFYAYVERARLEHFVNVLFLL